MNITNPITLDWNNIVGIPAIWPGTLPWTSLTDIPGVWAGTLPWTSLTGVPSVWAGTVPWGSVTGVPAFALLSGATFTGDITASNLSGTNTGDQDLSPYALLTGATFTGGVKAATFAIGSFPLPTNGNEHAIEFAWGGDGETDLDLSIDGSSQGNVWNDAYCGGTPATVAKLTGATFTGDITASNLSGTNTGDKTLGENIAGDSLAVNGLVLSSGDTYDLLTELGAGLYYIESTAGVVTSLGILVTPAGPSAAIEIGTGGPVFIGQSIINSNPKQTTLDIWRAQV